MMSLISLHGILSLHDTDTYDVDEIDKIDSEDRHSSRDLASCDDRESRDEKCKYDGTRVSHESSPRDIESGDRESDGDDDSEYEEKEVTILLCCERSICEDEFDRETTEYEK
jgi:hypothetical protein